MRWRRTRAPRRLEIAECGTRLPCNRDLRTMSHRHPGPVQEVSAWPPSRFRASSPTGRPTTRSRRGQPRRPRRDVRATGGALEPSRARVREARRRSPTTSSPSRCRTASRSSKRVSHVETRRYAATRFGETAEVRTRSDHRGRQSEARGRRRPLGTRRCDDGAGGIRGRHERCRMRRCPNAPRLRGKR